MVVRSETWVCRLARAFCVVARSVRRRCRLSFVGASSCEGVALRPFPGMFTRSLLALEGCGESGAEASLCATAAVRSASLVTTIIHQYFSERLCPFETYRHRYMACVPARGSRVDRAQRSTARSSRSWHCLIVFASDRRCDYKLFVLLQHRVAEDVEGRVGGEDTEARSQVWSSRQLHLHVKHGWPVANHSVDRPAPSLLCPEHHYQP